MNASEAAAAWRRLAAVPGFDGDRTNQDDGYTLTSWQVDTLCSLAAFTRTSGAGVRMDLRPHGSKRDQGLALMHMFPWLTVSQFQAVACAQDTGAMSPIRISVTLYGENPNLRGSCLTITDVSDPAPDADRIRFFRTALAALGCADAVELNAAAVPATFRVLRRDGPGFTLQKVAWTDANEGELRSSLSLLIPEKEALLSILDRLESAWPGQALQWTGADFRSREDADWETTRQWLNPQHSGPWEQRHIAVAKEVWAPMDLASGKADGHDVIPVGMYRFTRGKRTTALAPALKGIYLHVDLFREPGEGWHFALHLIEEQYALSRREKIRQALNEVLGTDFITRTPETLWPHIFRS